MGSYGWGYNHGVLGGFWNFFLKKARKMNRNEGRHDLSHNQLLRASKEPMFKQVRTGDGHPRPTQPYAFG